MRGEDAGTSASRVPSSTIRGLIRTATIAQEEARHGIPAGSAAIAAVKNLRRKPTVFADHDDGGVPTEFDARKHCRYHAKYYFTAPEVEDGPAGGGKRSEAIGNAERSPAASLAYHEFAPHLLPACRNIWRVWHLSVTREAPAAVGRGS